MKTKIESKPSHAPWKTDGNKIIQVFYSESWNKQIGTSRDEIIIGTMNSCEQAEEAARAVNSHEALIARLNGLIASLESVRANIDGPDKALKGSWYSFDQMISDDISRTRKAIAQAEGK